MLNRGKFGLEVAMLRSFLYVALLLPFCAHAGELPKADEPSGTSAIEWTAHGTDGLDLTQVPGDDETLIEWAQSRRIWRCTAVNQRGQVFSGQGASREQARRTAMSRCASRSNSCRLRGCR
jgi:hypothetical protein